MASDDSDNEGDDYALFGTALDPIDEEDIPRKRPVPIEEQVKIFSSNITNSNKQNKQREVINKMTLFW